MKFFYPGRFALPATLVLAGVLSVIGSFGIVQTGAYRSFLALGLIAAGLEELYFWARATTKETVRKEGR